MACVTMRIFININSVIMRIAIIRIVMMRIVKLLQPVQLVQMEDGEHDCQDVDKDPDGVQHIVAVRTLRPRVRISFRSPRC